MSPAAGIEAAIHGLNIAALLLPHKARPVALDVIELAGAAARRIADSGRWTAQDDEALYEDAVEVFRRHKPTKPQAEVLARGFSVAVGICVELRDALDDRPGKRLRARRSASLAARVTP